MSRAALAPSPHFAGTLQNDAAALGDDANSVDVALRSLITDLRAAG